MSLGRFLGHYFKRYVPWLLFATLAALLYAIFTGVTVALITSMLPTDLFVRPSDGGVVIWPNWYAAAAGSLPIRIDLRRPS